jgi:hypothetical protein
LAKSKSTSARQTVGVAYVAAGRREQRVALVLAQPALEIEVVVLLAPQHARQRLAMHPALILGQRSGRNPRVEFVGVGDAALEGAFEAAERIVQLCGRQTQPDRLAAAGGHVEDIVGRGLGPGPGGIHRFGLPPDEIGVKRILDVGRCVRLAPQALRIALVLGEEQLRCTIAVEPVLAQLVMRGCNGARPCIAQ